MNHGIRPVAPYRVLISRCLVGYCLIFLVVRAASGLLPSQLQHPVLTNFHYDIAMWIHKLSGTYRVIGTGFSSVIFNILLFGTGILAFFFPCERVFIIAFSVLYFLVALHFSYFLCHNGHYMAGAVWLLPVLWAKRESTFQILWEGGRYFTCYVYTAAFVYKLIHGAAFQWNAGLLTTKENYALYLFQNPNTFAANCYYWFIQHPLLLDIGHKIVTLAEGLFIIGFFTKKHDKLLIIMVLFIHFSTFLFSDVFFAEMLVLALPLFPLSWWKNLWLKTVPNSVHHLLKGEEQKCAQIAIN